MTTIIGTGNQPGFLPEPQWRDENFDPLAVTIPGNNNAPAKLNVPGTNLFMASFPAIGGITEVPVSGKEVNHDWVPGTNLSVHAHILKTVAGTGDVKLSFEYRVSSGSITPVYGTISAAQAVPATEWTIADYLVIGEIPMSTFTGLGAQVTFRLFRDGSDSADTYNGAIVIHTFGWHYQVNSNGSRLIASK